MKSKVLILIVLFSALCLAVLASAGMIIPFNPHAQEVSQGPEHSGAIDENFGLERVDFIHYVKPPSGTKPSGGGVCYKLLGVKWSTLPVRYTINPTNKESLNPNDIKSAISASAETWDAATSQELFDNTYSTDSTVTYNTASDGINAISFGPMGNNNIIAVTSIWYTRVGKRIVEFDILFNDYFAWGTSGSSDKMDLQNIATHELGHAVGMNDIYTSSCSDVTMYGYSSEGETTKRTLEPPDIAGLQAMYGV
jgi:predicted Zn-dependent protease